MKKSKCFSVCLHQTRIYLSTVSVCSQHFLGVRRSEIPSTASGTLYTQWFSVLQTGQAKVTDLNFQR